MIAAIQDLADAVVALCIRLGTVDGLWQEATVFALVFPAAMSVMWTVFSLLFVLTRERRLPGDPVDLPGVTVVIPAHNEELTIGRTIDALLAQHHPDLRIVVVSDGSTDRTEAIARTYASRGVSLMALHPNRGKSEALNAALARTTTEFFMVVDADTVADPEAIAAIVRQFADPRVAAVTGNPRVGNVTNLLTAMQAMEYSAIIGLIKRADSFWGGLFTVSGAAACFRTAVLRDAGGWSTRSATEDIEASWRLQKAGWSIVYEPRAIFRVQAPTRLRDLHHQRRRWARGMVEVLRLHGNLLHARNPGLIPIATQAVMAIAWLLVVAACLLTLVGAIWRGEVGTHALAGSSTIAVVGIGMLLFVAQTAVACTLDAHYVRGTFRLLPLALLYPVYYWIVILPSVVLGGARGFVGGDSGRWARTERTPPAVTATITPGRHA